MSTMKTQHIFLVTLIPLVDAYITSSSSFIGRRPASSRPISLSSFTSTLLRMDTEESDSNLDYATLDSLEKIYGREPAKQVKIEDVEASLGMPWKASIDPEVTDEELLYMPFWEWQMSFMKDNLTNLRVQACTDGKTDFSYNENTKKKARIVSMCASSDEYRKIRMTYYDAGDNTQVFNAVCYPDPSYNLPILGIDLLAFNRKKYLAIVDFQPIHDEEEDHATTYEHILKPIKNKYDSLKGRMSSKFYDETKFFSQEMLFARFDDESIVSNDLFPAFKSYVETHLKLIRNTEEKQVDSDFVLERQAAYDTYSAERDPATGFFAAMFGGEWANDFVHNFLFSMSEQPEESSSAAPTNMPFMGGSRQRGPAKIQQSKKEQPVQQREQVESASFRA